MSSKRQSKYCVLMVYCGLNNNTFKLFLKDHMLFELFWLFLLSVNIELVINEFKYT